MSSQSTLLELPTEIRILIYRHYLLTSEGYFLDIATQKLRMADDQPINLSLMYTCKLIAREMRGMALGVNLITFSTAYLPDMCSRIGKFDHLLWDIHLADSEMLKFGYKFLDTFAYTESCRQFPQFKAILDCLKDRKYGVVDFGHDTWGESYTESRRFTAETVRLMARQSNFEQEGRETHWRKFSPSEILSLPRTTWIIPDSQTLDKMTRVLKADMEWMDNYKWKFRLSAAAIAIKYLSSMTATTRSQIRNILLLEDQTSSAFPETHAQGLIEFCQENPQLRIERRVSLWRAVWTSRLFYNYYDQSEIIRATVRGAMTSQFGKWISEALALASSRMPAASFTLTFDADGTEDLCSTIFQEEIHRGAAWQAAMDICGARQPSLNTQFRVWGDPDYIFKGFPEAMQNIVSGDSCIRFTFNPGVPWDVEKLMAEHPKWTDPISWRDSARRKMWKGLRSDEMLSRFKDLMSENLM